MAETGDGPALKIDLGFSLTNLGPKLSFEIPMRLTKKVEDGRSLPVSGLRTWWNAWRDGKRALPDYDGEELSSFEQSVRRAQSVKIERLNTEVQLALLRATEQIGLCRPPAFAAGTAVSAAKHTVFGWLKAYRGALRIALQNMQTCKVELEAEKKKLAGFVSEKELVSERPRSRMAVFDRIGLLMLACFLEALISMVLFFDLSDFGYFGGAAYALVISMANVISGLFVGFIATYAFNIKKTQTFTVLAICSMSVLTLLVFWMNLFVAHFREKSAFSLHNIVPNTALSGVLLVIGMSVWGYAVYKGWSDFEPDHDGHRDLWNSYSSAKRAEEASRLGYERLATNMRGRALAALDNIRRSVGEWEADHVLRLDLIGSIIRAVEAIQRLLPETRVNIIASCEQILRRYRETNYTVRRRSGDQELKLKYTANFMDNIALDINSVLIDAKKTEAIIEQNQAEFARFRELFESDIASHLSEEIEQVEEESEKIRAMAA